MSKFLPYKAAAAVASLSEDDLFKAELLKLKTASGFILTALWPILLASYRTRHSLGFLLSSLGEFYKTSAPCFWQTYVFREDTNIGRKQETIMSLSLWAV